MFAAKDRPPHGTAASSRPSTLAASLPTTSSEFSPAASAPEQRKMNTCPPPARRSERRAFCFDNDTKPFCRNPPCLISIQNPRGCAPSVLLAVHKKIGNNLIRMNTYAKRTANSRRMRTYKIIGLKVSCNEHLQKNGGGGGLIVTQPKMGIPPGAGKARRSLGPGEQGAP